MRLIYHSEVGHNENVLVKEAWVEKVPVYADLAREICNRCGKDITENYVEHEKAHALAGEGGGRHTEYVLVQTGVQTINHPAEYEDKWVIDQEAWSETIIVEYKCSYCDETRAE